MQAKGNRTSLVAPWLRIHLPMQGTCVWSLVREDPTCLSNKALGPQLLSLPGLKPTPQDRSSHFSKKSTKDKTKSNPHSLRLEEAGKLVCGNKDPGQPKIHEKKKRKGKQETLKTGFIWCLIIEVTLSICKRTHLGISKGNKLWTWQLESWMCTLAEHFKC